MSLSTMVLWDGLDEAFVGIGNRCGQPPVAVYDRRRCVEAFVAQGMTEEEAEEWLDFNVVSAWVGEQTPIIVDFMHADEAREWAEEDY